MNQLRKGSAARSVLVALLLGIPAYAMCSGAFSGYAQLRPPMTLTNVAGDSLTDVFRVFGAAQVDILIRSAAAEVDSLVAVGIQVSNDGVNYTEVAKQTGIVRSGGGATAGSGLGLLGKTGKHVILTPPSGVPFMPWTFMRVSLRSGAGANTSGSGTVDSLCVDAWWFDTLDGIYNKNSYQPTVR